MYDRNLCNEASGHLDFGRADYDDEIMTRLLKTLPFVVALAACSSSTAGSAARPVVSGGHNLLTEAELQAAAETDGTLYDTIQRLRPTFLRSRQVRTSSTPNPEPVHVFVNGQRAEGLEVLRQWSPQLVKEVRFYEPQEANVRFGTGHHGGLIAVTLNR
jgi:hypothetical protein